MTSVATAIKSEVEEDLRRRAIRLMVYPQEMPGNAEPLAGFLPSRRDLQSEKIESLDDLDFDLPEDVPTTHMELRDAFRLHVPCADGEELVLTVMEIVSRHHGTFYIAAIDGEIICIQRPKDFNLRQAGVHYNSESGTYD